MGSLAKRVSINVDQDIALHICRLEAGDLVSIHSEKENVFIGEKLLKVDKIYWIGYQTNGPVEKLKRNWTDGSEVDYNDPGRLAGPPPIQDVSRTALDDKNCYIYVKKNVNNKDEYRWESTFPCSEKKKVGGFICKIPAIVPEPSKEVCEKENGHFGKLGGPLHHTIEISIRPSPTKEIVCDEDWILYEIVCDEDWILYVDKRFGKVTKCFFFNRNWDVQDKHNWFEWKHKCSVDKNATLATIENKDEEEAIINVIYPHWLEKFLKEKFRLGLASCAILIKDQRLIDFSYIWLSLSLTSYKMSALPAYTEQPPQQYPNQSYQNQQNYGYPQGPPPQQSYGYLQGSPPQQSYGYPQQQPQVIIVERERRSGINDNGCLWAALCCCLLAEAATID
uniref:C-type lectin domain-containing protein n=1 Tax=Acrobeloides nanus TaxID=290746 RepID=A0A914C218_9BILA